MTTPCRICLVTSAHVSANPRLVKEADALVEEGFDVTVVAIDMNEGLRLLDRTVLESRPWKIEKVSRRHIFIYALQTILQRAARFLLGLTKIDNVRLARLAHDRLDWRLSRAAGNVAADLYLAHTVAGLGPAFTAAQKNGAKLGFDAEDFHTEELTPAQRNSGDQVARDIIQQRLLPRCVHLSASSPLIADAYRKKYGVEADTILNVFPISDAPASPLAPSECEPRSMYWFSQTIGEGRGLEAFLEAMSYLSKPATLWLRGNPAPGYERQLRSAAERLGVEPCLRFLPVSAPDTMARLAQPYQLGLAIEPGVSFNNQIALSNKAFTYVLAGIPVLFSRTPAQEALAAELGDASLLVDLGQPREVARVLDAFFEDESLRERARHKAWLVGRERYNWDIEKLKFLSCVRDALGGTL
ncbi:MAG TPA: hypothetical protein VM940_03935 [Chthoniobacterales bacterium]|nr:hypothetical protein [Chthoniobacterales bacterium]